MMSWDENVLGLHSSISHACFIPFKVTGGWSLSQLPLDERRGIS